VYVISYTCHTHKGFFAKCVCPLDIFGTEPILRRRGLQRINLHSINIWHQIHPSLSFHHPSSSSDHEKTPNSLDGEISGFTSLLPVFTMGLTGLSFLQEMGLLLLFSFCCLLRFRKGTWDRLVSYLYRYISPLVFSSSMLYGQTVMIFAEPGTEYLAPLVKTVDSGLQP
jgi:hypothetical protein